MEIDEQPGSSAHVRPETRLLFDMAQTLPPLGILAGLSDHARSDLAKHGVFQKSSVGVEIISEGTPQNRFYLVLGGELAISTCAGGKETFLSIAKEGECLGETSLLEPGPASATVRVTEEATIWSMGVDDLRAFLEIHAEGAGALLIGIATCLSQRLRHANDLIAQHHVMPVETLPQGRERAITADNALVQISFFDRVKKSLTTSKRVRISTEIKM